MICLSVWTFVTYYFDATKVVNQAGFPARNRLRKNSYIAGYFFANNYKVLIQ